MAIVKQGVPASAPKDALARLLPGFERDFHEARESRAAAALQQSLRESQQHYQALLRHLPGAFARCCPTLDETPDFVFLEVNPAFAALIGQENIAGRRMSQVVPALRDGELLDACGRVAGTGVAERFETRAFGDYFEVSLYRPARGEFVMLLERCPEPADAALRRYIDEAEDLYQNAPCGYYTTNRVGRILRMNDTQLGWLGYGRKEVEGRLDVFPLLTPASNLKFHVAFAQIRKTGCTQDVEVEFLRKDGTRLPALVNAAAVTDEKGRFLGARASVHDLTALRQLSMERETHARQLTEMSHRLVCLQEQERRRLAGVVHDSISPNLSAAKINLGILHAGQPSRLLKHHQQHFDDIRALLDDADACMRDLCSELCPPLLGFAGLLAALDGYTRQFAARTGLPVSFICAESALRLPEEVETTLFRIVQEALSNCARHSRAKQVSIRLWHDARHASISIDDDGVGFDPAAVGAGEQGIVTMRERAEFIGGKFRLEASAGQGTRISVEI